jgi:hypothetical protein
MTQSIWPNDHALEDSYAADKPLGDLWCFVICPANPPEYWNDLFSLINGICSGIGKLMGVPFRCRRAVDIVSAGIIHPEIWRDIRAADLVIADITGRNGNVMLELGVASAWLDKERVIIIREDVPGESRLFDINPARQIDYTRSPSGFQGLANRLLAVIQDGIARAPFERPAKIELAIPASLDLTIERDCKLLWGLSGAHRRILPRDGLEFGSLYNFRYGWLSLANVITRNVRVKGEFRFTSLLPNPPNPAWMGIMLRSQGYLASSGHLALLRGNGVVAHTQEVPEAIGTRHEDVDIGTLNGFDPALNGFVPFDISIDEHAWTIEIGSVKYVRKISDLPHVFSDGRIIVEGQFCWVCLRRLEILAL